MRGIAPVAGDAPFRITPDLRFLFQHAGHEAVFSGAMASLQHDGTLVVAVGSSELGKTMLLRRLETALAADRQLIAYVPYPTLGIGAMLASFCSDPDVAARLHGAATVKEIAQSLGGSGGRRVLLVDDADRCPDEALRDLHELTGQMPEFRVVLGGGWDLPARLRQAVPHIDDGSAVHLELAPLRAEDIEPYLQHRLRLAGEREVVFSADAIAAIGEHSQGVPRAINQLCSRAMILAQYEGTRQISLPIIREAVADCPAFALAQSRRRNGSAAQDAHNDRRVDIPDARGAAAATAASVDPKSEPKDAGSEPIDSLEAKPELASPAAEGVPVPAMALAPIDEDELALPPRPRSNRPQQRRPASDIEAGAGPIERRATGRRGREHSGRRARPLCGVQAPEQAQACQTGHHGPSRRRRDGRCQSAAIAFLAGNSRDRRFAAGRHRPAQRSPLRFHRAARRNRRRPIHAALDRRHAGRSLCTPDRRPAGPQAQPIAQEHSARKWDSSVVAIGRTAAQQRLDALRQRIAVIRKAIFPGMPYPTRPARAMSAKPTRGRPR